ncbi:MAG: (5-formylfuran-3-yl)methyl phosphate synthase [Pirellulales bacterium]|nr:(5-formylfuran-3-yl)methyl phosphate synthase [Pirellulales bacterium]
MAYAHPSRLLVSVRDEHEARLTIEAGVGWIDVKEPRNGSLGAAPAKIVAQVLELVGNRAVVSAARGELLDGARCAPCDGRLALAKFGLAGCARVVDWPSRLMQCVSTFSATTAAVAVIYADWRSCHAPEPEAVLELAQRDRFAAVLVDTFDKSAGGLFEHQAERQLEAWIGAAQQSGHLCVLAGSLDRQSLRRALELGPDLVAVRGAVCGEDRAAGIDPCKLAAVVEQVRNSERCSRPVGERLLSGRA